ncbi:MAG TPA: serine hydrolase [Thermoanaerobaculia bacterium]|nr:serine hydrolase [Thermoanaerobaculia bacterium]
MTLQWTASRFALLALVISVSASAATSEWRQYEEPARAGWSVEQLEVARKITEEVRSAAVMVVEDGTVVVAWGEVDRPFPIYSMRKGLYSALAGIAVEEGRLDLETTLNALGVSEIGGLSEEELSATVEHLLSSRSGVYRVSAYEPASMKRNRPDRGSHRAGEHWFYNNWDFNVIAHLIESASGENIETLFRHRIAEPLGMQDLSENTAFLFQEPSRSLYPAVIFRLSARDLARFGLLYERKGLWNSHRILEEEWVEESWRARTDFSEPSSWEDATGFGYMWWIHRARSDAERPFAQRDIYLTRGSHGQVLAIVPSLDLVVVHLTDTETGEGGTFEGAARVIDAVIASKTIEDPEGSTVRTTSLRPEALPNASPAPEPRTAVAWSAEDIRSISGEYALGPQVTFVVHEDGRLFALPKGVPMSEVELFRDAEGRIFSPVLDVKITVVRTDEGRIAALEGQIEGRPVRIERLQARDSTRKE